MRVARKSRSKAEFGDFQTPARLAQEVCALLSQRGATPATIVEPTCGSGSFLFAALEQFPKASSALALEINPAHVAKVRAELRARPQLAHVRIIEADFFDTDWPSLLRGLQDPIVFVGNPPWVTNSDLGALGSTNLPEKSNFQNRSGLDAITGKSNFDISEWMLTRSLEWLGGRSATLAMLCKTAVARRVLCYAWRNDFQLSRADMFGIDAMKHFNAAVEACLLVCDMAAGGHSNECSVYSSLHQQMPDRVFGFREGLLLADVVAYDRWKHLRGQEFYKWRSGIKHDCRNVMEFRREGRLFRNGLGELVELEETFICPMLKSSELANDKFQEPKRWMLVTQRSIGEDTASLGARGPLTWDYLQRHASLFDRRASSIYKDRPQFSIFGVGEYTFAPWKVATSGFYKKLGFKVIGPFMGKPVVLDDTSYFLPCKTEEEAEYIASLLNSEPAREFLRSFIFWDSKRPITIDLLKQLDLLLLSRELGSENKLLGFLHDQDLHQFAPASRNLSLFLG
jgi:hypothetical protein